MTRPLQHHADFEALWVGFVDRLEQTGIFHGRGDVAGRMADRIFSREVHQSLTSAQILEEWRSNLATMYPGIRSRRVPGKDDDPTVWREVGRQRAELGVPVADVVRASAIYDEMLTEHASTLAEGLARRDDLLLELMRLFHAWSTWGIHELVIGYRQAELAQLRRIDDRRQIFLEFLLAGRLTASEIYRYAEEFDLDDTAQYRAVRARATSREVFREIEKALGLNRTNGLSHGMATVVDGDLIGFVRADSLTDLTSLSLPVGLGMPCSIAMLASGLETATRAHQLAIADEDPGVVIFDHVGLSAVAVRDEDIVDLLMERSIRPLLAQGEGGRVILETVQTYLDCGTSVSETAQILFVHPNTVRYRLARFESAAELRLTDPADLAGIVIALAAHRVLGRTREDFDDDGHDDLR